MSNRMLVANVMRFMIVFSRRNGGAKRPGGMENNWLGIDGKAIYVRSSQE